MVQPTCPKCRKPALPLVQKHVDKSAYCDQDKQDVGRPKPQMLSVGPEINFLTVARTNPGGKSDTHKHLLADLLGKGLEVE